jgi:hypothetical protein
VCRSTPGLRTGARNQSCSSGAAGAIMVYVTRTPGGRVVQKCAGLRAEGTPHTAQFRDILGSRVQRPFDFLPRAEIRMNRRWWNGNLSGDVGSPRYTVLSHTLHRRHVLFQDLSASTE